MRATRVLAAGIVLVVGSGCASSDAGSDQASVSDDRLAAVAEAGAAVMPFSLDLTHHTFAVTDSGGEQTVVALDPADREQVDLIRAHLAESAGAFAAGDFAAPASIHGHDMPGLAVLAERADDLSVVYHEMPDGARLVYTAWDPEVREALHLWFAAQVADHGDHASHG